jgi:hypothetical protein
LPGYKEMNVYRMDKWDEKGTWEKVGKEIEGYRTGKTRVKKLF